MNAGDLLRRTERPPATEILVASLLIAFVGILAFGSYVLEGGFYSDDWSNASEFRLAESPRYWTAVEEQQRDLGGRPGLALLIPLPFAVLGLDPDLHLSLALALGVVTSLCFYVLLRTLSLAPLEAGAIAVLALLFPWSDSIRLWPTASLNAFAVCFFLLGLVLALRGLRQRGGRAVAMHGAALALYLLSVLTYEVAAAAILLAGFLYLGRAPRAKAARRWLADAVVVLGALVYSLFATIGAREIGSVGERLSDVPEFARQSLSLLASALLPVGSPSAPVKALVLLVVGAAIVVALRRLRHAPNERLRTWTIAIGIGGVWIGASYVMFMGSTLHPLEPGLENRTNVFAALGFSLLVFALVAVCAEVVAGRRRRLARWLALALAVSIGIGYAVRVGDDQALWERSADLQGQALRAIDPELSDVPTDGTLLTFGYPAYVAPGVPIFAESWDLRGAIRLEAGDPTLDSYPVWEDVAVRCENELLVVEGPSSELRTDYEGLFFLDLPTGRRERVGSPAACRAALRTFRPGPRLVTSSLPARVPETTEE